jgi:hypothetical protein
MNKIRSDFPPNVNKFFLNLQNYVDSPLYFYGSVNRSDYVHTKSDIDVAIFTDNEYSMMTKIQHFLRVKRNAFDKVVWKLEGKIIYGYKIICSEYTDFVEAKKCEIVVYNNDFKETILNEMRKYNEIPFYIKMMLFVIKTLYYTFPLLSSKTYSDYKRIIFNKIMIDKKDTVFFLLKQNKI